MQILSLLSLLFWTWIAVFAVVLVLISAGAGAGDAGLFVPAAPELRAKCSPPWWQGQSKGFCKFGPEGYIMPAVYKDHADAVTRMQLRPDDIWVVTFPRSGTTWTQEMVWLLKNNLDYETAKIMLEERYFFIEYFAYLSGFSSTKPEYILSASAASPRFIKTHLPLSLLPPSLLDTCKVVFVARDPRDVAYSYYQHNRMLKMFDFIGDFKTYWQLFQDNLILNTPFFAMLKEAWSQRHHANMLFIFYEELIKDLPSCVRRIAKFLGKEYNDDQIKTLCEHLDIKNFKHNQSVNPSYIYDDPDFTNEGHEGFIRKGKAGGWREHFDAEMAAQADQWIQQQLSGTDLRFPETDRDRDRHYR